MRLIFRLLSLPLTAVCAVAFFVIVLTQCDLSPHTTVWRGINRDEAVCAYDNWYQGRSLQTCVWRGLRYTCIESHDDYECAEIK